MLKAKNGTVWNFDSVTVVCETAVNVVNDITADPGGSRANSFVNVAGSKGEANLDNCNIRFKGNVFYNSYLTGRSVSSTEEKTDADYSLPVIDAEGKTTSTYYYYNAITATNSKFDAYAEGATRLHFICNPGSANCYFKNCEVSTTYAIAVTLYDDGSTANDPLNVVFEDSVVRVVQIDVQATKPDKGGAPTSNCDIAFINSAFLASGAHGAGRGGNLRVTVGTRATHKWALDSTTLYYDKDDTCLSTTEVEEVLNKQGVITSYRYNASAADVEWVYDPVGNVNAPWVVVKKGTVVSSVWTEAKKSSTKSQLINFEDFDITHNSQDAYNKSPLDCLVTDFNADGYAIYNAKLSTTGYATANISAWQHNNWNHLTGNFGIVKDGSNAYLRWYAPQNPNDPTQTSYTVKKTDGTNGSAMLMAPTPGIGDIRTKDYQVMVFEISIATESKLPEGAEVKVHTRDSGYDSFTAFTFVGDKIVPNALTLTGSMTEEGIEVAPNTWYHFTCVIYSDPSYKAAKGSGHGIQYWYINGEQIGYTNGLVPDSNTADTLIRDGIRIDFQSKIYIGDTLLMDNMATRLYTKSIADGETIGNAETKGKHNPGYYVVDYDLSNAPGLSPITVGGVSYDSLNDAIDASADTEFGVVLHADKAEYVTTKSVAQVYTNGYTLTPLEGSVSYFKNYATDNDFSEFLPDYYYDEDDNELPALDVDNNGNQIITFDASKKVPVIFETPNGSDLVEFYVGETPTYTSDPNVQLLRKGQQLYRGLQSGWAWTVSVEDANGDWIEVEKPIGALEEIYVLEDYDFDWVYELGIVLTPYYTEELIPSSVRAVVIDANGNIRLDNITGNDLYGSGSSSWKLAYGETLVFNNTMNFRGTISLAGANNDLPRDERVFGIDFNGHVITYNPTPGGTDSSTFFKANIGSTLNVYSSVPGGRLEMYGAQYVNAKDYDYIANGDFAFSVENVSTEATNIINTTYADNKAGLINYLQNNDVDAFNTNVNIGKVTDAKGTTHPGSNLKIYCDGLIQSYYTDRSSVYNVEDVVINKTSRAQAIFFTKGFNGTLNLTNVDIFGGALHGVPNYEEDRLFSGNNGSDYYKLNEDGTIAYRCKANVNVSGGSFFSTHRGQWMLNCEEVYGKVHFENYVTNAVILGTTDKVDAIWVGNNVYAIFKTPSTDERNPHSHVSFDEGVEVVKGNWQIEKIELLRMVPTRTGDAASNSTYTFAFENKVLEDVLIVTVATSDPTVKVTVNGINGSTQSIVYKEGATVLESDFANQLTQVNSTVTAKAFAGTFNGGSETLPMAAKEITLVPDTKVVSNVNGMLANLSLYSGFEVNVYVPKAYVEYINTITVDGAAVAVSDAKVVVIDGEKYIKLDVEKNALEISEKVTVVINYTENDTTFDVTSSISILDYAKVILAGNYTDEEKALMKYIIAYANVANTVEGVENDEVAMAAKDNAVTAYEKNYVVISEEDSAAIGTVFAKCVIDLEGSVPAYVFTVAKDYNGKVTLNGVEYDAVAGETITVEGIRAYDFLAGVTIEAEGVNVTFTFSNYGAWAAAGGVTEEEMTLVDALYDYCYAAELFIAKKNA